MKNPADLTCGRCALPLVLVGLTNRCVACHLEIPPGGRSRSAAFTRRGAQKRLRQLVLQDVSSWQRTKARGLRKGQAPGTPSPYVVPPGGLYLGGSGLTALDCAFINQMHALAGTEPELLVREGRARLAGMTWQEAEHLVLGWLQGHGHRDATLTPPGADGGVDIRSRKAVVQVKHHASPVGIKEVQRIAGIGAAEKRAPMLFAHAGVTKAARDWARAHGVACYTYPRVKRL